MSDTLGPLTERNLLEVFGQRDSARRAVTAWTTADQYPPVTFLL